MIPISVHSVADRISSSLRRLGAEVEWTEIDQDPVALIEMPKETVQIGDKSVTIKSIQLLDQQLVITGVSDDIE